MKNSQDHKYEEKLLLEDVIKIEEQASKIIEEAKEQAKDIIAKAHIQAQNIINDAHKSGELQAQLLIEKSILEIQKEGEILFNRGMEEVESFKRRAESSINKIREIAIKLIIGYEV
ncbi:MAG: hypothetical protein ABIL37_00455 [candidate division WOR-3 bacterium]